MQLAIQQPNVLNNTTFKSKYPNGLRCACCNKKMIDNDVLNKTYASASRSISYNFRVGAFSFLETKLPEVYKLLEQFKFKFPKLSLGKILYKDDNYNLYKTTIHSNVEKLPNEELNGYDSDTLADKYVWQILNTSHNDMQKSSITMQKFAKYKKYLTGEKLKTFEQLEIYARKYPNLTLSEIINLDEIYKFHMQKDFLQRVESRENLDFHFQNIKNMVTKVCPEKNEYMDDLKETALEKYETCKDEAERIYSVKEMYKNALLELGCTKLEKKVMKELDALPKSFVTKDSFFAYAKNHGYNDGAILESLFSPYMRSEEHIVARSNGGTDKKNNKIYMCRSCNLNRKNYPYTQFLSYHPEMIKNAKIQVNRFAHGVLTGELPYTPTSVLYPIEVAELLRQVSEGKININTDEYAQQMFTKSQELMRSRIEEISEKERQRKQLVSEKRKLEQESAKEELIQKRISKYLKPKEL